MRNVTAAPFRLLPLVAVTLVLAAAAAPAGGGARQGVAAEGLESLLLVEVNAVRRRNRFGPLRTSPGLRAAADAHSAAMARRGFFGHESEDGTPFWKRVRRFYPAARFRSWSVGENLLWSSPDITAREAVRRWLASPGHRRNLLSGRWREIGLGAVHARSAPGVFGGAEVTIVTADFGIRR
jgi:uncharacterized protein YkwD